MLSLQESLLRCILEIVKLSGASSSGGKLDQGELTLGWIAGPDYGALVGNIYGVGDLFYVIATI